MPTDPEPDLTVESAAARIGVEVELLLAGLRRYSYLGVRERCLGEAILPTTRVTFALADQAAYQERRARIAVVEALAEMNLKKIRTVKRAARELNLDPALCIEALQRFSYHGARGEPPVTVNTRVWMSVLKEAVRKEEARRAAVMRMRLAAL